MAADVNSFVHLGGGFARDATHLWFRSTELPSLDATKLFVLAADYASDGTQLAHRHEPFTADAASFEVLGVVERRSIARDRRRLYVDAKLASGPDPSSFTLLGAGLASDRDGVWNARTSFRPPRFERLDADRDSLRILDDDHACDRDRVWHRGTVIEGAIGRSFQLLGHGYATDGERFFAQGQPLDEEPAELVVLDEWHTIADGRVCFHGRPLEGADTATWRSLGNKFGIDARRVYFDGVDVEHADPASFTQLAHDEACGWARDRARVWYRVYEWHDHADGERLYEVDVEAGELEPIDEMFARAGDRVLRGQYVVEHADAATFRAIEGSWYSDATAVWFGDRRLPGAAPGTLRVHGEYAVIELDEPELRSLGEGYAAAATGVVFAGWSVDGPSPDGARSLSGGYFADTSAAWFYELATESRKVPMYVAAGGRLEGADPATLRRDHGFAIDRGAVFCGTTRIPADPSTFRALDAHHGTDGAVAYFDAQPIATDPAKLRVLGGVYRMRGYTLATADEIDDAWATDGTTLFVCGQPVHDSRWRYLDEASAERLRALELSRFVLLDRYYATDDRAVVELQSGRVNDSFDAATFRALGDGYARDRTLVWSKAGRLHEAQWESFDVLGDGYATDSAGGWYFGTIFQTRGRLHVLGGGWARDELGILCAGTRVDADPDSFLVLGSAASGETDWDPEQLAISDPLWQGTRCALGRDRDHLWWGPPVPGYRASNTVPASAVVIAHGYALTDTAVFHAGTPIEADAATFAEIGDGYARDAHRTFFYGEVTR